MREEEVNQMRQEIAKQTKMREAIQKKFHQMEDQKADVDVQRETLKAQVAGLEKGMGACHVSSYRHTHMYLESDRNHHLLFAPCPSLPQCCPVLVSLRLK